MTRARSKKLRLLLVALLLTIVASPLSMAYEFSCQVCLYQECTPVGLDYGWANCWIQRVCWESALAGPYCYEFCQITESCELPPPVG